MCAVKEQAPTESSLMLSTFEDRNNVHDEMATTSAKLQIAEELLTAAFDHLKKYSGTGQRAQIAVRPR